MTKISSELFLGPLFETGGKFASNLKLIADILILKTVIRTNEVIVEM